METVGKLVKDGVMKINDFIYYEPDIRGYYTSPRNTGCESQRLTTDLNTIWKIRSINSNGSITITTTDAVNWNEVFLSGIVGYVKGINELNQICKKLYSKTSISATARSFTLEDCPEYDKSIARIMRRAYYPNNINVEGMIVFGGNQYKKTICEFSKDSPKFYTFDGGGIEEKNSDGLSYRTPTKDNPVFVTSQIKEVYEDRVSNDYWLASQSVVTNELGDIHCISYMDASYGSKVAELYNSNNKSKTYRSGIRPIVYLSSILPIEESYGNGQSPRKAWKIAEIL